jgi:hypothetical protein
MQLCKALILLVSRYLLLQNRGASVFRKSLSFFDTIRCPSLSPVRRVDQ